MTGRAFILVGSGTPWRIPGPAPSPLPPEELENTCGNPACRGAVDHVPPVRPDVPFTPAEREAILRRTYGRH